VLISAENYSGKSGRRFQERQKQKRTGIKSRPFYYRLRLISLSYTEPLPVTVTTGAAMSRTFFTVNQ